MSVMNRSVSRSVSAPLTASMIVYALGSIMSLALDGTPGWKIVVFGGGSLALLVSLSVPFCKGLEMGNALVVYAPAVFGLVGVWLLYITITTPYSLTAVMSLIVITALAGLVLPAVRRDMRHHQDDYANRLKQDQEVPDPTGGNVWERILAASGFKGMELVKIIENRSGITLHFKLGKRAKFSALRAQRGEIEKTAARMLDDPNVQIKRGSIKVEEGELADDVQIHVITWDVLAEILPFPMEEHYPISINNSPLQLGLYADGSPVEIDYRYLHTLLAGMTDSGKSSVIACSMAHWIRCVDVVVWVSSIDKGIPLVHPWLDPWIEQRTDRPVLDWIAVDIDESVKMLLAAYKLVHERADRPRAKKSKITPSQETPQLVVILEEAPGLLRLKGKYETHTGQKMTPSQIALEIIRLGRSEAVSLVIISQRGTVSMLGAHGGDMKENIALRIGMRTSSKANGNYVLPDEPHIDLSKIEHAGSMYVKLGKARAMPAKAYFLDDESDVIGEIAEARTQQAFTLSGEDEKCLGQIYAQRWSDARAGAFIDRMRGLEPQPLDEKGKHQTAQTHTHTARTSESSRGAKASSVLNEPLPDAINPEKMRQRRAEREKARQEAHAVSDEVIRGFEELLKSEADTSTSVLPELLQRVTTALTQLDEGRTFITTADLAQMVGYKSPAALGMDLRKHGIVPGKSRQDDYDGESVRGYVIAELMRALENYS